MDEKLQYKAALALAKRTLEFVGDYRTPPTPHAYELFYTVAAGLNPELNEAVAGVIAEKHRVSAADVERLHQAFFVDDAATAKIEEIGKKLNAEVSQTLHMLGFAAESTRSYGDSLNEAEKELAKDSGGAASPVIRSLVAATQRMAETNNALTANLRASQAQVNDLEKCLRLVREETSKDALTGLTNRKRFDILLNDAMHDAVDRRRPLSLLLADIDDFKKFNDTFGHLAGDAALKYIAGCLTSCVKGQDEVARFGGEEFAILLPDTNVSGAVQLADHIRSSVNNRELVKKSSGKSLGKISISVGVTEYQPEESADAFLHRADMCLYAAKQAGRNTVCSEPLDDAASYTDYVGEAIVAAEQGKTGFENAVA